MYKIIHKGNIDNVANHTELKRKENVLRDLREDYIIIHPNGDKVHCKALKI